MFNDENFQTLKNIFLSRKLKSTHSPKYFIKHNWNVLFQATTAFLLDCGASLSHRQVKKSQNALDSLIVFSFCFFFLFLHRTWLDPILVLLFCLATHILHNTLETFYIIRHEYQRCRFINFKGGALVWFDYKPVTKASHDGALESLFISLS